MLKTPFISSVCILQTAELIYISCVYSQLIGQIPFNYAFSFLNEGTVMPK